MSKCENCIHDEVCWYQDMYGYSEDNCERFKDKSLYIEPPCELGIKVYVPVKNIRKGFIIAEGFAEEIMVRIPDDWERRGYPAPILRTVAVVGWSGEGYFDFDDFGKRIFTNREDAEKKLKEIENESNLR